MTYLTPIFENFPAGLMHLKAPIWGSTLDPRTGKPSKAPLSHRTGRGVLDNDPEKFGALAEVVGWWKSSPDRHGAIGLGIFLEPGIVAIDIDHAYLPDGVTFKAGVAALVAACEGAYMERSPGGGGVHILMYGTVKGDNFNNRKAAGPDGEVFAVERYKGTPRTFLTMTGHPLAGSPTDIGDAPLGALAALDAYSTSKAPKAKGDTPTALPINMADLPDASTLITVEDLVLVNPALEQFLDIGEAPDRSGAVRDVARALRMADLDGPAMLAWLCANPVCWDVAMSHRGSNPAKAREYLEKEHVQKSLAEDTTGAEVLAMFDVLAPLPSPSAHALGAYVSCLDLLTNPPPPREWVLQDWAARRTVSLFSAAGGIGKSALALHLGLMVALGRPFLGLATTKAPVLGFFAEDETDEIRRRLAGIVRATGVPLAEAAPNLHLVSRLGMSNLLTSPGPDGVLRTTATFAALKAEVMRIRPGLVFLDTSGQTFGGNEVVRRDVTTHFNALQGLALESGAAIIVLAHPAKNDTEYSGSTAFLGSVRSLWFMNRNEGGFLDLKLVKSNYGPLAALQIDRGVGGAYELYEPGVSDAPRRKEIRTEILAEVRAAQQQQRTVSASVTATNYLPTVMGIPKPKQLLHRQVLDELIAEGTLTPRAALGFRLPGAQPRWAWGLAIAPTGVAAPTVGCESLALEGGDEEPD